MRAPQAFRLAVAGLVAATLTVALPSAAAAAAPANDDFANATAVGAPPFGDTVTTTDATTEAGEPTACNVVQTVWYAVTPAVTTTVSVQVSGFDETLVGGLDRPGSR